MGADYCQMNVQNISNGFGFVFNHPRCSVMILSLQNMMILYKGPQQINQAGEDNYYLKSHT